MSEKDQIIEEKLKHGGIWNFKGFYEYAHGWFAEQGYGVTEEKYEEKVSGNSRDLTIEWKATRTVSDYFKIETKLRILVTGLTEVEVEIDGKKKKSNKGTVEITIKGNLIKDPKSKWENSALNKFLRDVYNKYVIPGRVDDMEGKVFGDVQSFKDAMKGYLELSGKR